MVKSRVRAQLSGHCEVTRCWFRLNDYATYARAHILLQARKINTTIVFDILVFMVLFRKEYPYINVRERYHVDFFSSLLQWRSITSKLDFRALQI